MNYSELKKVQVLMNRTTANVVYEIILAMTDEEKKGIPTLAFGEKETEFIKTTATAFQITDFDGSKVTIYEVGGSYVRITPKEESKLISL